LKTGKECDIIAAGKGSKWGG